MAQSVKERVAEAKAYAEEVADFAVEQMNDDGDDGSEANGLWNAVYVKAFREFMTL